MQQQHQRQKKKRRTKTGRRRTYFTPACLRTSDSPGSMWAPAAPEAAGEAKAKGRPSPLPRSPSGAAAGAMADEAEREATYLKGRRLLLPNWAGKLAERGIDLLWQARACFLHSRAQHTSTSLIILFFICIITL